MGPRASGWRCTLTLVTERYTDNRHDNFDTHPTTWPALRDKLILGVRDVCGGAFALMHWRSG